MLLLWSEDIDINLLMIGKYERKENIDGLSEFKDRRLIMESYCECSAFISA
jgi:hypothetical protein